MTDRELVEAAQAGDSRAEDTLIRRYAGVALKQTRGLYLPGCDRDDLEQEALVALLVAVRAFRPETGTPFAAFAAIVVRRRLITAVKQARGESRLALTDAVRFVDDRAGGDDPERLCELRAELGRLGRALRGLSPLERCAIVGRANGLTYAQIVGVQGSDRVRRIDNALQRARHKLAEAA